MSTFAFKDSLGPYFSSLRSRRLPSSTSLTDSGKHAWKPHRKHIHESPHDKHPISFLLTKKAQRTSMASGREANWSLDPRVQTATWEGGAMGNAGMSNGREHFNVQTVQTTHTPPELLNAGAETPAREWVSNGKPGGEGDTGDNTSQRQHS